MLCHFASYQPSTQHFRKKTPPPISRFKTLRQARSSSSPRRPLHLSQPPLPPHPIFIHFLRRRRRLTSVSRQSSHFQGPRRPTCGGPRYKRNAQWSLESPVVPHEPLCTQRQPLPLLPMSTSRSSSSPFSNCMRSLTAPPPPPPPPIPFIYLFFFSAKSSKSPPFVAPLSSSSSLLPAAAAAACGGNCLLRRCCQLVVQVMEEEEEVATQAKLLLLRACVQSHSTC